MTTAELDDVAAARVRPPRRALRPALDYDFPGTMCISVDDECVHGIPGPRRLREGQLVKLDVTAELNGYYADACRTVAVGRARPREQRLAAAAQSALRKGLEAATAGANVGAIGAAVQTEVERRGFSVCAELTGHGIGRRIHEEPDVPNVAVGRPDAHERARDHRRADHRRRAGDVHVDDDGWTIRTDDGSPSAHAEHTIVITDAAPLLVTA